MKLTKRLFALALVLCMLACLCVSVFADEGGTTGSNDYTDKIGVTPKVIKTYDVKHGTAPAETFTFSFEAVSYKGLDKVEHQATEEGINIPAINNVQISYAALASSAAAADKTKNVEIPVDASKYDLGIYTYKVSEVAPDTKTAGVTYSTENLYLVLTILYDSNNAKNYVAAMHYESATSTNKSQGFKNEYDSGSLTVTKTIVGNMATKTDKFEIKITFTPETGTTIPANTISDAASGTWSEDGLTYTIQLSDNESVTLTNIPAGTTYEVAEPQPGNYTSTITYGDTTKTIAGGDADTVGVENKLVSEVDMGVSLDSLPYILALAVAFGGAVVLFTRKRHIEE